MHVQNQVVYSSISAHSVKSHQLNRMLVFFFCFPLFPSLALHSAQYCIQWMRYHTHTNIHTQIKMNPQFHIFM